MRADQIDRVWTLFHIHPPHDHVMKYLSRAELYNVVWVGRLFSFDGHYWEMEIDESLLPSTIQLGHDHVAKCIGYV